MIPVEHFRLKPVVIEGVRVTDILTSMLLGPDWLVEAHTRGEVLIARDHVHVAGSLAAEPGDWIIRDARGMLSTVKASVLDALYEPLSMAEVGG